jgi:hypothetical protein
MVLTTITYDPVGGSDTQASGSGPATAASGTAAAHTSGVSSTNIELSGSPSLGGILVSSILYLGTSSGSRHLTRVLSVNNITSVITVEDSFNISAGSPVDWAVGGKRRTLTADTTRTDIADASSGWRFSLESGSHALAVGLGSIPTTGSPLADGPVEIVGETGTAPTLTWTTDASMVVCPSGAHLRVSNLDISNTTSTNIAARCVRASAATGYFSVEDCTLRSYGTCVYLAGSAFGQVVGCDIESTHNDGIELNGRCGVAILNNSFHNCGAVGATSGKGKGIKIDHDNAGANTTIVGNLIYDCHEQGIYITGNRANSGNLFMNNVIHGNGGDGVLVDNTLDQKFRLQLINNIITDNGGYGFSSDDLADLCVLADFNAYRGNTSGDVNNIDKGPNSVTLTADPYTDEAGDDYTPNDTAGGGAACIGAGLGYGG